MNIINIKYVAGNSWKLNYLKIRLPDLNMGDEQKTSNTTKKKLRMIITISQFQFKVPITKIKSSPVPKS